MKFIRPFRSEDEFDQKLNQIELWKLAKNPLDVANAIIDRYSRQGWESLRSVPGEAERLKWVGLYPQRQEGDAFMLRLKVPGGGLNAAQTRRIGEIVDRFAVGPSDHPRWGNRYCDITTRQDIQLHWVTIEDVPEIWHLLEDVELTSVQACGDSARNVLGCPVAGVDADEAFDATPVVDAISDFFTGNREYSNLPRKFKLSVTGCLDDCAQAEINDIGMWPARSADGELGFNLLVGGGLSDGPRMATDLDVFVGQDQAVECARAIAQVFGELGNRENRGYSRMRYLVQELGPEGFRSELSDRAAFPLSPAGTALTRRYRGDHVGVHAEHDEGSFYVGCSVPVGRISGQELMQLADLAEHYGDGGVRLATDQNFVMTGVKADAVPGLLAEPLMKKYSPHPGPFSRGVVACTGSEFCRFAIVETKENAVHWAEELDALYAAALERSGAAVNGDEVIRVHFSGCSASCAQPQIADIGLRGDTAHVGEEIVEAVDVALGGSLGVDGSFARWVIGALEASKVVPTISNVLDAFLEERRDDERFHAWVRRHTAEDVAASALSMSGSYRR
jgi:ferredoxin-nitrite reductase